MTINLSAFLDTIGVSEGTSTNPKTKDGGYDVLFGGGIFTDYSDHPRQHITVNGITSTAAGKYQILAHIFDAYKALLSLPDFSPASQDAIASRIIQEQHALDDIDEGNIPTAIYQLASQWASFPGNSYGQHQQRLDFLIKTYQNSGGNLTNNGE